MPAWLRSRPRWSERTAAAEPRHRYVSRSAPPLQDGSSTSPRDLSSIAILSPRGEFPWLCRAGNHGLTFPAVGLSRCARGSDRGVDGRSKSASSQSRGHPPAVASVCSPSRKGPFRGQRWQSPRLCLGIPYSSNPSPSALAQPDRTASARSMKRRPQSGQSSMQIIASHPQDSPFRSLPGSVQSGTHERPNASVAFSRSRKERIWLQVPSDACPASLSVDLPPQRTSSGRAAI